MDVTLPNGQVIKGVPDGTTKAQLAAKLKANGMEVPDAWLAPPATSAPETNANFRNPYEYLTPGVQRSLGNTGESAQPVVGSGEAALQVGTGLGASAVGGVAGIGNMLWNHSIAGYLAHKAGLPKIGSANLVEKIQQAGTYQPRTYAGDVASQAVSDAFDPNVKTSWLNPLAIPGNVGTALGDISAEMGAPAGVSTAFRMAPEVLFPYAVGKAGEAIRGAEAAKSAQAPPPVPSTPQLKAAKSAAYKAAEDAGVVISPQSVPKAANVFYEVAKSENLGRLPPKLKEAADDLQAKIDRNEPLTLADADKIRQKIGDAKKSSDASDRRLAMLVQKRFDKYLDDLSPQDTLAGDAQEAVGLLKEARTLHGRTKNSELVDKIERRAKNTGEANYTQAGEEAALRREFLRLANKDSTERTFTPEQQAAIAKVAAPGFKAGLLRNVGKMDPLKGGVPAFMATMLGGGVGSLGGPVGSVVGAASLGTLAHLANRGAARITKGNVVAARESLVGRGLPTKSASATPAKSFGMRAPDVIFSELRRVEAELQKLRATDPYDSPRRVALAKDLERLRAELLISSAKPASQQ